MILKAKEGRGGKKSKKTNLAIDPERVKTDNIDESSEWMSNGQSGGDFQES
jgi:hypothetical protein